MSVKRPICRIDDKVLYHTTNREENDVYSLQLYFFAENKNEYVDCVKRIQNSFKVIDEGETILSSTNVFKVSITDLIQNDNDNEHGFVSYTFENNYIRVYWNNNKKEIIFYS